MSRIIALGGGGFSMEDDNILLDTYIFSKARKAKPRVCFVGTASGDSATYSEKFFAAMTKHNVVPSELSLYRLPTQREDLETFILNQDVFYIGGGNTYNLMALWKAWNIPSMFQKALHEGVVLAGISAGAICWFESGVSDSFVSPDSDTLNAVDAVGFLEGSHCPHYDGEANRRSEYHRLIASDEITNGIAAEDGVGLFYENGKFIEAVSSRIDGCAFEVWKEPQSGDVLERTIKARFLG